jgi:precorrin-2/cobalt-factor-2 C20-methyltransferase
VVLMKIGARLPWVLDVLRDAQFAQHCAFARRIGLAGEMLANGLETLDAQDAIGYLATMLIRQTAREERT